MEEEERRRNVPGRRPEILLLDRHIREGDLKFVKKKFKKEYAQMMVQVWHRERERERERRGSF